MKRVRVKIGDVFAVRLDDNIKKCFQYVEIDRSQLDSPVIRAFKKAYPLDVMPDLAEIVADDVDFFAHVIVQWGLKMGLWEKVGHVDETGDPSVLFRDTDDCGHKEGEAPVRVSSNWYVWSVNEEFHHVGELKGENRNSEIGVVVSPPDIVHRMQTGKYGFVYPDYE